MNGTIPLHIKYISTSNGVFVTFLIDFCIFLVVLTGCCFLRQFIPLFQRSEEDRRLSSMKWYERAFQWVFRNNREYSQFCQTYGKMASVYLFFEKTIIIILFIISLFSVFGCLPLYLTGEVPRTNLNFKYAGRYNSTERDNWLIHTTVSMIDNNIYKMIAPAVLCYLYVIVVFVCMFLYTNSRFMTTFHDREKFVSSYTIQIKKVGKIFRPGLTSPASESNVDNHIISPLKEEENENSDGDASFSEISSVGGSGEEVINITDGDNIVRASPSNSLRFNKMKNKNLTKGFNEILQNRIYSVRNVLKTSTRNQLSEDLEKVEDYLQHFKNTRKKSTFNLKFCCCGLVYPSWCTCIRPKYRKYSPSLFGNFAKNRAQLFYERRKREIHKKINKWDKKFREKPKSTGYGHLIFKTVNQCEKYGVKNLGKTFTILLNPKSRYNKMMSKYSSSEGEKGDDKGGNVSNYCKYRFYRKGREPSEIIWRNFISNRGNLLIRTFIVHTLMIIYVFVFTSPFTVVNSALTLSFQISQFFYSYLGKLTIVGDFIIQYMPTLCLYCVSSIIPVLIPYLTRWEKIKYISAIANTNALRIYIYQVLTTIILPSLMLTGADGVLFIVEDPSNVLEMLYSMFLPASGAFFLNYLIHFSFITLCFNLMNLSNVFRYFYKKTFAVTSTELDDAQNNSTYFYLGLELGYCFQIFGLVLTYSLFCPIMVPLGFLFFFFKYWVDRVNIRGVWNKGRKSSHKVRMDPSSFKVRIRLIFSLMVCNILLFELFTFLFFLKRALSNPYYYIHMGSIIFLMILSVIYSLIWLCTYKVRLEGKENSLLSSEDIETFFKREELEYAYHPPLFEKNIKSANRSSFMDILTLE